jgi:hypothetical protein
MRLNSHIIVQQPSIYASSQCGKTGGKLIVFKSSQESIKGVFLMFEILSIQSGYKSFTVWYLKPNFWYPVNIGIL